MDLSTVGRVLLVVALVVAAVGLVLVAAGGLGLGRLPGDIALRRGNVRVYAPIASCLVVSVVLSLVSALVSRR
ncbi:MAG: DUF2905 family protein [Acidimicrobiales bacterium]